MLFTNICNYDFFKDTIPPEFDGSCPENITIFVDIKSIAIEVSWTEPIPVDNSEDPPIVNLVSGSSPGSSFDLNTSTLIQYMATDKSGNNSTCKFYVHIKGICYILILMLYNTYVIILQF